ncbi:ABC transporter permease [Lentisphaerota bacterium ZTH]|nr:ABC transporter permease [Lentisphaerota bacterium]WET06882.1 ABC transporter permease [Lentisphaerota bacterium ZTH]
MVKYIFRRLAYSILIIFGVVVLTFLLFRVAAGDPAAAVLGKNPSPREVEDLRNELGADLPLIYGKWRKTEAFTATDFSARRELPGVVFPKKIKWTADGLDIGRQQLTFTRNFGIGKVPQSCIIIFKGEFETIDRQFFVSRQWSEKVINIYPATDKIEIIGGRNCIIKSVSFYRRQHSAFNSQLVKSLQEIVSFKKTFPYVSFLNFGRTIITREPIRAILWRGVGPSLCIMVPIFIGELVLGIVLALFATVYKGCWIDRTIVMVSIAGMSISYLVFIIFGQWYLGYYFNWFPVWGWGTLAHLTLPVIIGIASGLGGGVRFYRTVFVNELNREYLRTAAAKGCSNFKVFGGHLLRNAAIPIITRASAIIPFLFTGSLLLETFFGIPGLGYLGVDALNNSDLQLLKALVIVSAALFVGINMLTDIAYAWADPRIRLDK